MSKIIKNQTEGYGYKYASLCDLAEQGIEIPKMTTRLIDGNEYIFYLDNGEWLQGARVVVPQNKGMNEAQNYGSAISYARRYTTLLAYGIATQDDEEIENLNEDGTKKFQKPTESQVNYFLKLYSKDTVQKILEHYEVTSANELDRNVISQYISEAKKRIDERWEEA